MSQLCSLLKFSERKDSPGKLVIELDRKKFREIPEFSSAYKGIEENNFREIYTRLYSIYKEKFDLKLNPPLTNPEEFQNEINDKDVLDMEGCLAILYSSMTDSA